MTKYLKTKKLIKKALEKLDTPEDKPSEVFFNIYQKELEAIIDVINENYTIGNVSEIQHSAKKELLNSYYVAIHDRNMSVEDIMKSIEADRQYLDGEITLDEAKNILNGL